MAIASTVHGNTPKGRSRNPSKRRRPRCRPTRSLGRGHGDRRLRDAPDDGKQSASVFVGQWAPTLLILGLYNKLVKQHGSDFTDAGPSA